MTEFEIIKKALERVYDNNIEVEEWDFDNSSLITVELYGLTTFYWFKEGKLDYIDSSY